MLRQMASSIARQSRALNSKSRRPDTGGHGTDTGRFRGDDVIRVGGCAGRRVGRGHNKRALTLVHENIVVVEVPCARRYGRKRNRRISRPPDTGRQRVYAQRERERR